MTKAQRVRVVNESGVGYVLFVAWIGALVYFVGKVDGFWNIILAFLKACVWPAYVLYHVLQLLSA